MSNIHFKALLAALLFWMANAFAAPVKIMPLGDSITQGASGHDSYRYRLWKKLTTAGYEFDFVGSTNKPSRGKYAHPSGWDMDHEGHAGWRADQILAQISGWTTATMPDIVLIHLGTNDMNQGQSNESIIAEIALIIDRIREIQPQATFLLSQIITTTSAAKNRLILDLNSRMPALVASKDNLISRVILVDHCTGYKPRQDNYDTFHPNNKGEEKMASRWFSALQMQLPPMPMPEPL